MGTQKPPSRSGVNKRFIPAFSPVEDIWRESANIQDGVDILNYLWHLYSHSYRYSESLEFVSVTEGIVNLLSLSLSPEV